MADLSHLSDEQLGAYRDLLAQKQAPPAPKPPLPEGLAPGTGPGEENSVGGSGNEPGLPAIVNQGIRQMGRSIPAFANDRPATGVSDVIKGGAKAMSPLAIPAMAMSPAATVGAAALGSAGHMLGSGVADALHASPETSEAVGDVASLPAAMLGGRAGSRLAEIPASNWMDFAQKAPWGFGQGVKAVRSLFTGPSTPVVAPPPVTFRPSGQSKIVAPPPINFRANETAPGVVPPPPVTFRTAPQNSVTAPPPITFRPEPTPGIVAPPPVTFRGETPTPRTYAPPPVVFRSSGGPAAAPAPSSVATTPAQSPVAPAPVTETTQPPTFANGRIKLNVRRS